jgi:SAM-dependent methyltransferase
MRAPPHPLRAFEELARTTEPGSAECLRVPHRLKGRAGPVRAIMASMKAPPAFQQDPDAGRLTEREYWDSIYRQAQQAPADGPNPAAAASPEAAGAGRSGFRRVISSAVAGVRGPDWFWSEVLPKFVRRQTVASGDGPGLSDPTVVEIGAAPGDEALMFHECFGYAPFGLEYTPAGAAATRQNFERRGVEPGNVIEGDLFDDALTRLHESRFDVVFSRGLIEHFTDPTEAVERHVRLAKGGGLVVITIPTLTGIHWAVARVMAPWQIAIHNLGIMRLQPFARLFENRGLETLYCGYQGGINLLLSYTHQPAGWRRPLQAVLMKLQLAAFAARRAGLCRGRYLNSSLVFIGRKREQNSK